MSYGCDIRYCISIHSNGPKLCSGLSEKGGSIKFCVEYHKLSTNAITNFYQSPTQALLDRDLIQRAIVNNIKEDRKNRLFSVACVMPFGLCNASVTSKSLIIKEVAHLCIIAYFNTFDTIAPLYTIF